MNVEKELKDLVMKIVTKDGNVEKITSKTILTDDLGYDSVKVIELVVELESVFNIEIDDDDLEIENLIVYENLLNMIRKKMKE